MVAPTKMAESSGRFTIRGIRVHQLFSIFYAMRLETREMCKFAKCTITSRNFIEGERLLNAGHIMNCGRIEGSAAYNILAFCVQTSGVKEKPHILKGEVDDEGKILSMTCSCVAVLSETCKHSVAVLLYLTR